MSGFLARAVLHGFKSFADRTEFEFSAGVTAIVGPNGCGKSNILDAVRWVLGEQSARSLRGDRMADVIFAGSRSRKPANAAEVQLIFDNSAGVLRSDDQEVTIGRVLYRNGESEYRLNGKPCRLRDVRELLLDTGVGVDAYSVIEQGRVDLLLQASPAQRREIFEEAAGISRYKVRRTEAQRKLERTQANLLRLRDILDELEKRLRSVRLAAGKARNWQQYDQRLRELRAEFGLAEYHELQQSWRRLKNEIDALEAALQDERVRLGQADAQTAELTRELQAQDDQIQAADAALRELQAALSTLRERISQGERRLQELAVTRDRRQAQACELAERVAVLERRIADDEGAVATLVGAAEEAAVEVDARKQERAAAEQECAAARAALERSRVAAFDAARQAALLQNEQANLEQQADRLTAQAQRIEARAAELAAEHESAAQRSAALADRLQTLDQQVADAALRLRADEAELQSLAAAATELDEQINVAKERRSGLVSRLSLLEDMERRREGVSDGTRAVLAWRTDGAEVAGVVGLVADLLRIDDPRVAALQAVLATFEDHVVVRDTNEFLDELNRRGTPPGPVRVLALDRLAARPIAVGYEHTPGFVARASDWVRCVAELRPLAEHLLGRTIIIDELPRALRLAGEALAGYVFVTLDGWTVYGDGRLTCGVPSAAAGLISRKTEIRQLRNELDDIETTLATDTRRRMELDRQSGDLQLRRQAGLEQIATLQRQHADVRGDVARSQAEQTRLERERSLVSGDLEALRRSLAELDERRRALVAQGTSLEGTQREHESQVDAQAQRVRAAEAAFERLSMEYTAALVASSRAAEQRAAAEDALRELRARGAGLVEEEAAARREADEAARQIDAAQEEVALARNELMERTAEHAAREAAGLALRERRQALRQAWEAEGTATREIQRRIEAAEGVLHEQQVALRETEVRREGLVARIRDELGLDLAERYATYEHHEQDWAAIRAEIEDLRGRMARLGNVNLDAIAELDELAPRYEHMRVQQDDLVAASTRLEQLIVDLDAESRTRFAATFDQVRAHFQEMFRKLFGGGKADVILENPDDPLESGIEIIARPPGKEPRAISLLSGGEKTMTAVALLLAVFRSRPSPFAILDEVDAALDESNTERFNKVLQEFLSHSQFLVITHSKRTMSCADVLYGITMEEPGVSKRVSVRFEERVTTPNVA